MTMSLMQPMLLHVKISTKNLIASFSLLMFFSIFNITNCYADNYRLVSVGESVGGGTVFCVSQTADTTQCVTTGSGYAGLIMANEDQANYNSANHGVPWASVETVIGSQAQSLDNGAANTATIINALPSDSSTNNAAWLAHNYRGGGYTDWYLPSKNELNKMRVYANANSLIGDTCSGYVTSGVQCLVGGGGNTYSCYWSSSEYYPDRSNYAWLQLFSPGYQDYYRKIGYRYGVRAVRAFSNLPIQPVSSSSSLQTSGVSGSSSQSQGDKVSSSSSIIPHETSSSVQTLEISGSSDTSSSSSSLSIMSFTKIGTINMDVKFIALDFMNNFKDDISRSLVKIKIITLPTNGTLKLSNNIVDVGREIYVRELGSLVFTPSPNWSGATSFVWNANNGISYALIPATVTIDISNVSSAVSIKPFGFW